MPANLSIYKKSRLRNIRIIIFGFQGSNFANVIKILKSMAYFDKGLMIKVNGVNIYIYAWIICYIGDIL